MSAAKMTSTASTGPSTSNDISLVSLFRFEAIRRAGEPPGNAPGSTRPPVAAPAYSVSLIMRLLYLVVQWAYYAIFRQPAIGQTACGAIRPMKGGGFAGSPMNGNRPRRAYMPEKWERPQNRGRSRGKREKERKGKGAFGPMRGVRVARLAWGRSAFTRAAREDPEAGPMLGRVVLAGGPAVVQQAIEHLAGAAAGVLLRSRGLG